MAGGGIGFGRSRNRQRLARAWRGRGKPARTNASAMLQVYRSERHERWNCNFELGALLVYMASAVAWLVWMAI